MTYLTHLNATKPQSEALPGQTKNDANGYTWDVDDWKRLKRFLVLGSLGGTYYASETKVTTDNLAVIEACIKADGLRTVTEIVAISLTGRAPKNEPAILALAMCFAKGDNPTKTSARQALPKVCRTGTHLLHFVAYADAMRGWGRALRRAVAEWYTGQDADDLAYQAVKYQSRDGWTHSDALAMSHPKPPTPEHQVIYNWITKGWPDVGPQEHPLEAGRLIWAFESAKTADKPQVVSLIRKYRLPREGVPTQYLTDPDVWDALLPSMGLESVLRNLGNMSKIGLLTLGSDAAKEIERRLLNDELVRKSRLHPIKVLSALLTYQGGHSIKGAGQWTPVQRVVDALNASFYSAFGNVKASRKRIMLAVDESGSMSMGDIAGVPGLTPKMAAAAMTLITAKTEPDSMGLAFAAPGSGRTFSASARRDLNDAMNEFRGVGSGTDCSEPIMYALAKQIPLDAIVIYTDSQTYAGLQHPAAVAKLYRAKMGIPMRLIVVGCTATAPTIADPTDALSLDLVGFDTDTPNLIGGFTAGEF